MRSEVRNLPELFLERFKKLVPAGKFDSIANTFSEPKPTTFRVNTLKTSIAEVKNALEHKNFLIAPVSWLPSAFILKRGRQKDLEQTDLYLEGEIYIQNLSSIVPPLILDPQPGESVLDLTAAPGGKTAQIACLMKGEGKIIANENDQIRYEKLKANLQIQGVANAETVLSYGESFGNKYPGQFDRVLVDAPCTAEGRFFASEPSSYRYWNLNRVKENAKLQKKLLVSGLKALKPGGILVYSTCTFSPEENEEVVNFGLESLAGAGELEVCKLGIANQIPGLLQWEGRRFHASLAKTLRILPNAEMEGFFVSRMKKR